jgi:hypothetical protein
VHVNLAQPLRVLLMQMYAQMRYVFQVLDALLSPLLMELLVMLITMFVQSINANQVHVHTIQTSSVLLIQMNAQMRYAFPVLDARLFQSLMEPHVMMIISALQTRYVNQVYVNHPQLIHAQMIQMYAQMRYVFQVRDVCLCQLLMEVLVRMAIYAQQEISAL